MQARRLYERIDELLLSSESGASGISAEIVESIDLIACSPLTRALQTTEIALVPHFRRGADSSQQQQKQQQQGVPIVALPLASERVYLISDLGTTTVELKDRFPYVDFDSGCTTNGNGNGNKDEWWWDSPLSSSRNEDNGSINDISSINNYVEWRPINEGQTYACLGEPEVEFNERMTRLYDWLDSRNERSIALVCHWGVIDWLTGEDFDNCEMRAVDFSVLRREGFMLSDEEAEEIFKKGERCVVRDDDAEE